jgi:hypothetical protein
VKLTIPFNDSSLAMEVMCSVPAQHNSLSRKFHDHRTYTDVNCRIPYIALVSLLQNNYHMRYRNHRITTMQEFLKMGDRKNIIYLFQVHRIINTGFSFCTGACNGAVG